MPRDQRFDTAPSLHLVSMDRMEARSTCEEPLQGTVRSLGKKERKEKRKIQTWDGRGSSKSSSWGWGQTVDQALPMLGDAPRGILPNLALLPMPLPLPTVSFKSQCHTPSKGHREQALWKTERNQIGNIKVIENKFKVSQ